MDEGGDWDGLRFQVFGLKELALKLEILDQTVDQAGEEAGHKSAEKIARTARAMMPVGPGEGGHVRDTARAEGMEAIIGGTFFPYTGWLEFGGRVGKIDPATGRFGIWREKVHEGRYLYPSYLMHSKDVDAIQSSEFTEVIRNAGFEPVVI